jgi:Lar family restriction alleviation protein
MSEITLKPCPFCGGEANMTFIFRVGFKVECTVCGCKTALFNRNEDAINVWNRRADDEET